MLCAHWPYKNAWRAANIQWQSVALSVSFSLIYIYIFLRACAYMYIPIACALHNVPSTDIVQHAQWHIHTELQPLQEPEAP